MAYQKQILKYVPRLLRLKNYFGLSLSSIPAIFGSCFGSGLGSMSFMGLYVLLDSASSLSYVATGGSIGQVSSLSAQKILEVGGLGSLIGAGTGAYYTKKIQNSLTKRVQGWLRTGSDRNV